MTVGTATTYTAKAINSLGTSSSGTSSSVTTTNAYSSIASAVVSGSAAQIVFNNIPQNYTHLQIRGVARGMAASPNNNVLGYQFNIDSGANYGYGWHYIAGDGAAPFSGNGAGSGYTTTYLTYIPGTGINANIWGPTVTDILDYSSVVKYKTIKGIGGYDASGSGYVNIGSGIWYSLAPISSITVICANAPYSLAVGSTIALYGIA
jgi:hypothetical protein